MLVERIPAAVRFLIADTPCQLKLERNEKTALSVQYENGAVTAELYYDFEQRPLCLTAEAMVGDEICLAVYPYRVELYCRGRLCDEEGRAGKRCLSARMRLWTVSVRR